MEGQLHEANELQEGEGEEEEGEGGANVLKQR